MEFRKEDFNGVYAIIFERIGESVAREIHSIFGGQQFNFPKKLHSKEYVINYLRNNYDGTNAKELSKQLDYSERWVKIIINEYDIRQATMKNERLDEYVHN